MSKYRFLRHTPRWILRFSIFYFSGTLAVQKVFRIIFFDFFYEKLNLRPAKHVIIM